jgi:hypothetical protein
MPYYTLIIKDQQNRPLRQFSGSREAVQFEYDSLSPTRWNGCTALWRTRKGKLVEKKTFAGLIKEKRKSSSLPYHSNSWVPPKQR